MQINQLLQQAFRRASELPHNEQEKLARLILAELESGELWEDLFARPESEAMLERLGDDALTAHKAGLTELLILDN